MYWVICADHLAKDMSVSCLFQRKSPFTDAGDNMRSGVVAAGGPHSPGEKFFALYGYFGPCVQCMESGTLNQGY